MIKNGKFGKKSISSFVDTRCLRQLYISLGNNDPKWLNEPQYLKSRSGYSSQTNALTGAGKQYEQDVYTILLNYMASDLIFQRNPPGHKDMLRAVRLDSATFLDLYNEVDTKSKVLLLEHQWQLTTRFIQQVFGIDTDTIPTLANDPSHPDGHIRTIRPDLIVIHKVNTEEQITELCSDGTLRPISSAERKTRWAINIIDVKHTPSDSISHRHFAEILFYARSLALLLKELNLTDKFFVHANGNGILGKINVNELAFHPWQKLLWTPKQNANFDLLYQPFYWRDVSPLFTDFEHSVRELWRQRTTTFNLDFRNVPLKIQPACGRCPYVDHCVTSLTGYPSPIDLRDKTLQTDNWGIELIPGIKSAIVDELKSLGIHTISKVVTSIQQIDFNNQISPLYGEKDTIYLKAKAIQTLSAVLPAEQDRFQSVLLPHKVNMTLLLNLETERPNNVVFSYGLRLSINAPINQGSTGLNQAHTSWWSTWVKVLEQIDFSACEDSELPDDVLDLIDLSTVYDVLSADRFAAHHTKYFKPSRKAKTDKDKAAEKEAKKEELRGIFNKIAPELIRQMLEGLSTLKLSENLKRKTILGINRVEADVSYHYTEVSGGLDIQHEYTMLTSLIDQLYHILNICHATETLVIGEDDFGTSTYDFAGFYWSPQQLDHLLELVNRHYMQLHVEYIAQKSKTFERFEQIQDFINPSASNIRHSQYHKKLYDIQSFLRQGIAFPEIISYSWHDLITIWLPNFTVDRRFWAPLFNFMDFTVWYDFLNAKTTKRTFIEYEKICSAHKDKLNSIDIILRAIHILATQHGIIPSESEIIETKEFTEASFTRRSLNSVAKLWVGLHELNVSTNEMEADRHRLTWPNFSISKLKAAKVDDLIILDETISDAPTPLQFFIPEMSSNVKVSTGDEVRILCLNERDGRRNWKVHTYGSIFKITKMTWTTTYQSSPNHHRQTGFVVEGEMVAPYSFGKSKGTSSTNYVLWGSEAEPPPHSIFNRMGAQFDSIRYMYQIPKDFWGGNLNRLLRRFNFGQSKLSELVALQSGWRTTPLRDLNGTVVSAPEVYLYWPKFLPSTSISEHNHEPLKTKIYYPPDASQQKSIQTVLSHPITCIQGPPGTGKSQTIVALIDDFIQRTGTAPKVLVTASTYAALNVVADKIVNAWEGNKDNPKQGIPPVRRIPMIFTGNEKKFTLIPQNSRPNSPIFIKGAKTKWLAKTQWVDSNDNPLHTATLSTTRNRYLFEHLLPEFGHNIDDGFIVFTTGFGLMNLGAPSSSKKRRLLHHSNDFGFDLIIIDEASQLATNVLMASLQLVKPFSSTLMTPNVIDAHTLNDFTLDPPIESNDITRLVLVGDHNQLPPISQVKPPEKLKHLIDSAFFYYLETHLRDTPPAQVQLQYNYRSHADIVHCIKELSLYTDLDPAKNHAKNLERIPETISSSIQQPWLRALMSRDHVVNTIVHDCHLDTVFSKTEAQITVDVIVAYFEQCAPASAEKEILFWNEQLGVVSPHNAHGSLIIRSVQQRLTDPSNRLTHLDDDTLQERLQRCIASVDKFQGSARDFIIGTMGISAEDQLRSEETFFYDINRFNVLISRAKSKMLLICSKNFAMYTPSDIQVMPVASKMRSYVYDVCLPTGITGSVSTDNRAVPFELRTMQTTSTQTP